MAESIATLAPAALAVFAIVLGLFGGMSYGFYNFGMTWTGFAFFAGLVGFFAVLVSTLRGFFNKYTGRILFGLWLVAVLGAYFVFLFERGKYPMGIDLAGGTELIYVLDYSQTERNIERAKEIEKAERAKDPESKATRDARDQVFTLEESMKTAPDKAAEVVRKRVDPTGTKGIPVTTLGSTKERLRIQLPKATLEEVERIKNAISTQGRLNFHIDTDRQDIIENTKKSANKPKTYIDPDSKTEYVVMSIRKQSMFSDKDAKSEEVVVRRIPEMDGSQIALATARRSQETAGFEIGVRFTAAGSVEFGKLTEKNVHRRMAIVLDGEAYSAPTIQEAIYGECRISGSFSEDEARRLAGVLTAGSLPAEVKLESEFTVGPSLGRDQIDSGMRATFIAAALVMFFMIVYYRLGGLIAAFCTLLNLVMLLGAMGFFKATLTLPGIAGMVLTLGMAVDANVLILERLREELARGRPLRLAVTQGFDRAFITIIDCNLTTLIAGVVLYYLGTGPVRGFAVSLSIGILTTLFCNLWLNWIITEWLVSRDAIQKITMMQIFKNTNFDFMKWRKTWYVITGGSALAAAVLFMATPGIYDVDFTGGTLVQFNFAASKARTDSEVKKEVDESVRAGLEKRVGGVLESLKQAASSGKTGAELRQMLAQTLPEDLQSTKTAGDITPDGLKAMIAGVEKAKGDIKKADLLTQGFGRPVEGRKYTSFTVTTRLTDPVVIEELDRQLLETFKADLEAPAVVAADGSVLVRFERKESLTEGMIGERVRKALDEASKDRSNEDIRQALTDLKVAKTANDGEYVVATLSPLPADVQSRGRVLRAVELTRIEDRAGGPISRKNGFGSQVAGEMKWQALAALIVANIGVFIYVWFRFEFSGAWGFGAIVALVHDVLIAAGGVVAAHLLGFPILINLNIVAALLTIIGFSVNDTIVTFDRIREVKAAHPTRDLESVVNEAVNATLGRTILTATTVLLADLCLLLFGGPTIQDMALTLLIGFIAGTYSSVFIASPLMIWWYRRFGTGRAPTPTAPTSRPAKGEVETAQV